MTTAVVRISFMLKVNKIVFIYPLPAAKVRRFLRRSSYKRVVPYRLERRFTSGCGFESRLLHKQ